jgi:hypothetical protein
VTRDRRHVVLLGLLVTALTWATYWTALDGAFIDDDVRPEALRELEAAQE